MAKWLLKNEPSPIAVLFLPQPVLDDLLRHVCEQVRRDSHVIEEVRRDLVLLANITEHVLDICKQLFVVVEITARVIGALAEPFNAFLVGIVTSELVQIRDHLVAKLIRQHLLPTDANDREVIGHMPVLGEIVDGREELAFR